MIIYKYIKDYYEYDPEEKVFCKEHDIAYFKPSKFRQKWLEKWLKRAKLPTIECEPDVICYWRHFGTWGMYCSKDNTISICPYQINRAGGLEDVIKHELTHLQHPELNQIPHDEKERQINKLHYVSQK